MATTKQRNVRKASQSPRGGRALRLEAIETRQMLSADPVTSFSRFESAEALSQFLITDALQRWSGLFGQSGWARVATGSDSSPLGLAVANSYSETNVQVTGVDEGDTVETDGNYIYVLSGKKLTIVDARSTDTLSVTGQVSFDEQPVAEYLLGDRLAVLSYANYYPTFGDLRVNTVGMSIMPMWDQHFTLSIIDVSDRAAPHVEQKTVFDGNLVDSRVIDNTLVLASSHDFYLPAPQWSQSTSTYETQAEYLARVEGQVLDLALPHYKNYGSDGQLALSGLLSEATDVYQPTAASHERLTSVTMVDLAADATTRPNSVSVPTAWWNQAFVTPTTAYLFQSDWSSTGERTQIYKFDLDAAAHTATPAAQGSLPGRLLNQFSADEYQGDLRVATTSGWGLSATNGLYVLRSGGVSLNVVGQLEGIAVGESIFSARFVGPQAFLVTFRRIDPLFTIDLSDPTAPQLTGELFSPGYSSYLHTVGDGLLVGLGKYVDPATGRETSAQISLFNVADPAQPQLADRLLIDPGNYSWLTVGYDHHAFAYYPESHVLTVPISGMSGTPLWVFRVNVAAAVGDAPATAKLELLGTIAHSSGVQRSVQIGDRLFAVSDTAVSAHEILHPDVVLAKVAFNPYVDVPPPVDPIIIVDRPPSERPEQLALPAGADTIGLYDPSDSQFWLKNSNASGYHDLKFDYGAPQAGWIPLSGDWNGDGTVTIGLFDPNASIFYLTDDDASGAANHMVFYGAPGANWMPLVGDWNGDGVDTVGLFDPQTSLFHLRNSNTSGVADLTFGYGAPGAGWTPVAGDWNGDGVDSIGLYDNTRSLFMLRNLNSTGVAEANVAYGAPNARLAPLAGDWNNDGVDSIGLYDATASQFLLRNTNTSGVADVTANYGAPGWKPVVGDWNRPQLTPAAASLNAELVDSLFGSTL